MDGGDAVGGGGGEELVSSLSATPHYNSAILEDMCMKDHLAALHGICGDSEAFRDAIILGKACYYYMLFFVSNCRKYVLSKCLICRRNDAPLRRKMFAVCLGRASFFFQKDQLFPLVVANIFAILGNMSYCCCS